MPDVIDHDTWNHSIPKLPKASKIMLGSIYGVLPFDGVRNPSSRSAASHKVHMTYRTRANGWQPKVGIGESAAEIAAAHEALICPNLYDLKFQPLTVNYRDEDGAPHSYTHDLLLTFTNGHRRLVFIRNETSLLKPRTTRQIKAVLAATPKSTADDMIVVNANDYPRQRRDNLFLMHHYVFSPDAEADDIVWAVAKNLKTLWYMRDLFAHAPLPKPRVFAACYRLVASGKLSANLNQVLWEHSHIEIAA